MDDADELLISRSFMGICLFSTVSCGTAHDAARV